MYMYMYMYVCVYIYIYMLYIDIYTYTHIRASAFSPQAAEESRVHHRRARREARVQEGDTIRYHITVWRY